MKTNETQAWRGTKVKGQVGSKSGDMNRDMKPKQSAPQNQRLSTP